MSRTKTFSEADMNKNRLYKLKELMGKITHDLADFEKRSIELGLQPSIQFVDETKFKEISEFTGVLAVGNHKNEWVFPFTQCESMLDTEHVKVFVLGGVKNET